MSASGSQRENFSILILYREEKQKMITSLCGIMWSKVPSVAATKKLQEKVEGIFNKISSYSTYDRSIKFE